jgi:chorismate synthase
MGAAWGKALKLTIFGESHGSGVGIVMDGLPPGCALDMDGISREMARRAPGNAWTSTPRKESDQVVIQSGVYQGKTTGTPLCGWIQNGDTRSGDYEKIRGVARPGHADWTGFVKYGGHGDPRGGGHFSGRLTAPLVFAGAVARQILKEKGIDIGSHVLRIASVKDSGFDLAEINGETLERLRAMDTPVLNPETAGALLDAIQNAISRKDSVGGVIECAVIGLPAGLGEPFFDSMESSLAHLLFSIPAVKGVEFGAGFDIAGMTGSQANDEFYIDPAGRVSARTNYNGGVNGGISNGMPVVFRVAVKPTPSIGQAQKTVNFLAMEDTWVEIQGRHDPCIVLRALPVAESAAALAALDFLLLSRMGQI